MSTTNGFVWIDRIRDCDREAWNRLANQYETPLLDWDWLRILEESGSVSPDEGWIPQHLLLYREGQARGRRPLYVKTHSAGEFVFDYAWAEVAEQLGTVLPQARRDEPAHPGDRLSLSHRPRRGRRRRPRQRCSTRSTSSARQRPAGLQHPVARARFRGLLTRTTSRRGVTSTSAGRTNRSRASTTTSRVFNKNQRRNIKRERRSMADQGLTIDELRRDVSGGALRRDVRVLPQHQRSVRHVGRALPHPRVLPMLPDGVAETACCSASAYETGARCRSGCRCCSTSPTASSGGTGAPNGS